MYNQITAKVACRLVADVPGVYRWGLVCTRGVDEGLSGLDESVWHYQRDGDGFVSPGRASAGPQIGVGGQVKKLWVGALAAYRGLLGGSGRND
jgi:hypothetical protein